MDDFIFVRKKMGRQTVVLYENTYVRML